MDKLRLMETYVEVVRGGSFAAAADKLGMSRGAVTKHVAKLEHMLRVRLLNRTTRQLNPTEIGVDYFEFCRATIHEIEDAEVLIARRHEEARGSLKLSAPKAFASLYLGALIAEFIKRHPHIEVTALISDSPMDRVNLVENGYDLVVRLSRPADSSVVARHICDLEWVVCASRSYIGRIGELRAPSDLGRANCLLHTRFAADGIWRFVKEGEETAVKVAGTMKSNSVAILGDAASQGLGIALLPVYSIAEELANKRLVRLFADYESSREGLFVLFPYRSQMPKKVRLFVDFLTRELRRPPWEAQEISYSLRRSGLVRSL